MKRVKQIAVGMLGIALILVILALGGILGGISLASIGLVVAALLYSAGFIGVATAKAVLLWTFAIGALFGVIRTIVAAISV